VNPHLPASQLPPIERPAWIADWRDFAFFHFAVEPATLAPHVPYPLFRHEGSAYVSLVAFRLERLRPAGWPARLGRWLLRPFSDHQFLNLRTYVSGPEGPGIHFIAEWIDNPHVRHLGPALYGLPYRLARMTRETGAGSGLQRIEVCDRQTGHLARLIAPMHRQDRTPGDANTPRDAFLLEHRLAYTHHADHGRCFSVEHEAWTATPFHLARFDSGLFEHVYPWFKHAHFVGGHLAPGFAEVKMSRPRRLASASESRGAAIAQPPAVGPACSAPRAIPCKQL
jgi:uncharacterized protein YqjF (DUF2071 family)